MNSDEDIIHDNDKKPEFVSETPTKKRKQDENNWTVSVRKFNLNSGKEYVTKTGKVIPARKFSNCQCKMRCLSEVTDCVKLNILADFNNLANKNLQDPYLSGLISSHPVNRRRTKLKDKTRKYEDESGSDDSVKNITQTYRRKATFHYKIYVAGKDFTICKMAFCGIFGIKKARVERLAIHKLHHTTPPQDKRGKSVGSRRNISPEIISQIVEHIKSFPCRISHYSRNESYSKHLDCELSVKKMHLLYLEKYEPNVSARINHGLKGIRPVVKYELYNNIFNTRFNLRFGTPRSDTCSKCDSFKRNIDCTNDPDIKKQIQTEHGKHLAKADKFYKDMVEISVLAEKEENVELICFDHQQNLPFPIIPSSEIYYKRKMYVFNQCFKLSKSKKSVMYMYDETVASKGSNETMSFLYHCVNNFVPALVDTLYIFADNCSGQNKSMFMTKFLSLLVATGRFKKIIHRFPEPGHSFLPCDRDFGRIEKLKRKKEYLFLPEEYFQMVQRACNSFEVVKVNKEIVKDFKKFGLENTKKQFNNKGNKFTVSKYRCFVYEGQNVTVSTDHNMILTETFCTISSTTRVDNIDFNHVNQLRESVIPLKQSKYTDIQYLKSKFVPAIYHEWYEKLTTENNGPR